jgi:hypothetical protein
MMSPRYRRVVGTGTIEIQATQNLKLLLRAGCLCLGIKARSKSRLRFSLALLFFIITLPTWIWEIRPVSYSSTPKDIKASLQRGVFSLCLLQDRDVGVSIFP